jgi:ATP citrate (pro-S)-lyase
MVTADHGPAVSGAHNTIVCARAGKDLVSSLVSGLLTIVSDTMVQSNCHSISDRTDSVF